MNGRLICRIVVIVFVSCPIRGNLESKEAALFQSLLTETKYDKRIKPTVEATDKIEARVVFGLARVESLDEKKQIMTSFGWLMVIWKDSLLQWDPAATGISRIVVPAENIWLPEIAMLNSVDEGNDLTLDTDFRVRIVYDGTVTWGPGFRWRTACAVDLTYFPFDHQVCELKFLNWMYQADLLNFTVAGSEVSLDSYESNGEWTLISATQYVNTLVLEGDTISRLPMFVMSLKLQRVPTYFLMNVVVPSILITFLSIVVFWLPYESGEKVSLGITVLLSFSIVLLMISDVTPRNGNSLPVLSWYILATMSTAGIALSLTICILNIYHYNPSTPVPAWVDRLVLNLLARVICMHSRHETPAGQNSVHPIGDVILEDMTKESGDEQQLYPIIPPDVLAYVRRLARKEKEQDRIQSNKDHWVRVGKIVDRFFFYLSFAVMFLTAVILFPVLADRG